MLAQSIPLDLDTRIRTKINDKDSFCRMVWFRSKSYSQYPGGSVDRGGRPQDWNHGLCRQLRRKWDNKSMASTVRGIEVCGHERVVLGGKLFRPKFPLARPANA